MRFEINSSTGNCFACGSGGDGSWCLSVKGSGEGREGDEGDIPAQIVLSNLC